VAVRHSRAVQRLSSATRRAESRPSRIGPINLGMKQMGERSAGNPHAAFDVEGTGDVARHRPKPARQSSTLPMRGKWKRSYGRATKAPPDERGGNRHERPTAAAPLPHSTPSATFPDDGLSTAQTDPERPFLTVPADGRVVKEAPHRSAGSSVSAPRGFADAWSASAIPPRPSLLLPGPPPGCATRPNSRAP
jgi:hypothetical protein